MAKTYEYNGIQFTDPNVPIDGTCSVLKNFLQFGDDNIETEIGKMEKYALDVGRWVLSDVKEESQKAMEAIIQYINDREQFDIQFRQTLRQSVILQLYSFMELYLTQQCEVFQKEFQLPYGLKDLKGNGELDTIKIFYLKSMNIDMVSINKVRWDFIQNFKTLRNKIVHGQGKFSETSTYNKLVSFSNDKTYSLEKERETDNYRIVLQHDFVIKSIHEVSEFLKSLIPEDDLYKEG